MRDRRSVGQTRRKPTSQAVVGRRPVMEAIRSGRAMKVLVNRESATKPEMDALVRHANGAGVRVDWVDRASIEGFGSSRHQGVAAVVAASPEMTERDLGSVALPPDALVVVLDGILDPQNVGASARAAEAAGASLLVVRIRRAAPVSPAAVRASAGALLHLPLARVPNLPRAVDRLKRRGFFVVGLDAESETSIHAAPVPPRPLALVVGSEERGLSRLVRERCDVLIAIPMEGQTSSLNASSALAVALFGYALRPEVAERAENLR